MVSHLGLLCSFRIVSNRCDTSRENLNSQYPKHFSSLYIFQLYKHIPESYHMTDIMSFRVHSFIKQQGFKIEIIPFFTLVDYTNKITIMHIFHNNLCVHSSIWVEKRKSGQWLLCIKPSAAEPNMRVQFSLGVHMVKGENWFPHVLLWPPRMCLSICVPPYKITKNNK